MHGRVLVVGIVDGFPVGLLEHFQQFLLHLDRKSDLITELSGVFQLRKPPLIRKPPPIRYLLGKRGGFLIRHFQTSPPQAENFGVFGVLQRGNRVENAFPGRLRAAGAKIFRLRR